MTPSYNHSYLAYRVGKFVDQGDKYNIHVEITLDLDGTDYVPDIALYEKRSIDFLHDKIKSDELPVMAVEILSPTQSVNELTDKIEIYLKAGIKSCWLIIPTAKTVIVFHNISQPRSYSSGNLIDSILDIEIPVAEIFK